MKNKHKKILLLLLILSLFIVLVACSGQDAKNDKSEESAVKTEDQTSAEETEGTEAVTSTKEPYTFMAENRVDNYDEVKHIQDWEETYPNVVASFYQGGEASEQAIAEHGVFAKNGHSTLQSTFTAAYEETPESFSLACLACHSGDYPWVYQEYGNEMLNVQWNSVKDEWPETDFWSCYLCHGNDPDSVLTTNSAYHAAISDAIPTFKPHEAVCAQCHTVFTGLDALDPEIAKGYDVHKNGYDLDGIYEALLDAYESNPNKSNDALLDGVVVDEETGIMTYGIGSYLDIEMFQGSVHQQLGMSCVDCHMPMVTAEDGTTFRSHNASGSVFENETAMNNCMACHTSDSIKTTEDMVAFTKNLQDAATKRYGEVVETLEELRLAVKDAMDSGVGEETVQAAKDAYSRAHWYLAYSRKTANDYVQGPQAGATSIHNYPAVLGYYDKAEALCKEHIDLLKNQ